MDEKLKNALTDFVNMLFKGGLPLPVREIPYGGRLVALQKKDGGIRPIAVGYTLRRLAAKCANSSLSRDEAKSCNQSKWAWGSLEGPKQLYMPPDVC